MLLRPLRPLLSSVLDPSTLSLTGWVRGSYSGSPWSGVASAGVSGSRSFDAGTAPSAGTALNGYAPANFVAASSTYLRDATNTDSTYLSSTGYRVVMLVKLTTSIIGPTSPIFNAAGLLTGDGGYWGIVYDDTGVHCYHFDGSYQVASSASAVATGGWHLVDVKYDGANITVSVDGTAGTPVAASSLSAITSYLRVGSNYADAVFADAQIEEVIIADASLSSTTAAMFKAYVNARYGLSL